MRGSVLAVGLLAAGCGGTLDGGSSVWTVGGNVFDEKADVQLAGDLSDGTWVVGVTDASGDTLLSPLQQVDVVDGRFAHAVALAPFEDSANGAYKAWAMRASEYPSTAIGAKGSGFHPSRSRTDSFRVAISGDIDPNPCPDAFGAIYGDVYGDLYGDVWGDVYGDLYGDHYGNVHGDVLGDLYGDHYGAIFGDIYGDQYGDQHGDLHGRRFGDLYGDQYGSTGGGC